MRERIERLQARLPGIPLDAFLAVQPENRRYLTGFTGTNGLVLVTPREAILITDFRYAEQAPQQAPHCRVEVYNIEQGLVARLAELVAAAGVQRIGIEAEFLPVGQYQAYTKALREPSARLVPTSGLVESLRIVKDARELAAIQEAAALTDAALAYACEQHGPGSSERQLAWTIERFMRERGADNVSFPPIVAAGSNGAMPHHRPDDQPVKAGEPVVIDIGAIVDGYCSDLTRTIYWGAASEKFRTIYRIVRQAQEAAIAALRPGVKCAEIDSVAREHIRQAGYGDRFGHGLGHGVGLQIHEAPPVRPAAETVLQAGMVVTIEPGIYLPGWGGVRIEDLLVVEPDGARLLSHAPKFD